MFLFFSPIVSYKLSSTTRHVAVSAVQQIVNNTTDNNNINNDHNNSL